MSKEIIHIEKSIKDLRALFRSRSLCGVLGSDAVLSSIGAIESLLIEERGLSLSLDVIRLNDLVGVFSFTLLSLLVGVLGSSNIDLLVFRAVFKGEDTPMVGLRPISPPNEMRLFLVVDKANNLFLGDLVGVNGSSVLIDLDLEGVSLLFGVP